MNLRYQLILVCFVLAQAIALFPNQAHAQMHCGSWFPSTNQVCKGQVFIQENVCDRQRRAVGTKNCCRDTSWSPSTRSQCAGKRFTQRSNCGKTRGAVGTYRPNNYWPSAASVCAGKRFTQKNSCGHRKGATGTKRPSDWGPSPAGVCAGQRYTQKNSCGQSRSATGTKRPSDWGPSTAGVCAGKRFTQKNSCNQSRTATGTKQVSDWGPAPSTVCRGQSFTQKNSCGKTRSASGTKNCCSDSSWTPLASTVCKGTSFTQTSNCGKKRTIYGTKAATAWLPAANTVCKGQRFTQSRQCGSPNSRKVAGTKATGNCCVDTEWTPIVDKNKICLGQTVVQRSNCGRERTISGNLNPGAWLPATNTVCKDKTFVQKNSCGDERNAIGTKIFGIQCGFDEGTKDTHLIYKLAADKPLKVFSQPMSDPRYGSELFSVELDGSNLGGVAHPVFLKTRYEFDQFLKAKVKNSWDNNPQESDKIKFCLRTNKAPSISPWRYRDPLPTTCGTHKVIQVRDCTFNTKGDRYPLCDECDGVQTSREVDYTITPRNGNWIPPRDTVCLGQPMVQRRDNGAGCEETRNTTGTRDPNDWAPARNTVCNGAPLEQTNSCGRKRNVTGTGPAGPWRPSWNPADHCPDQTQTQTNNCAQTRTLKGTGSGRWLPSWNPSQHCPDKSITQRNSCTNATRRLKGTKRCGTGGGSGGLKWTFINRSSPMPPSSIDPRTLPASRSCFTWSLDNGDKGRKWGVYIRAYAGMPSTYPCGRRGQVDWCMMANTIPGSSTNCHPGHPLCFRGILIRSWQRINLRCQ